MQSSLPFPWRWLLRARSVATARGGDGPEREPVIIYTAANSFEADVVAGKLEAAGIPTWRRFESLGATYGLLVGPLAQVDILVPAALAEQARSVLASADENDDRPPTTTQP